MNNIKGLVRNSLKTFLFIEEVLHYVLKFFWFMFIPKTVLVGKLLAAESQLAKCCERIYQKKDPKPRFTPAFRLLWVVLSKIMNRWEDLVHLMKPETVKSWHRKGFRLYWRWKSRRQGRPEIEKEMQDLIRRLSRENHLWGAERVRDTLLLLGYIPPCEDTIRKHMIKPGKPRKKSTSWAIDFFTVSTVKFSILYVFLVFDHGHRKVLHFATTYHPSMNWVIQQLREVTSFGVQPRYLFRDNDGIYGHGVKAFLSSCGIREVRTAYRSPWQNPYLERFIGTIRAELLNHVIILSEKHLQCLLTEFIEDYYHVARPHQGLNGETPIPHKKPAQLSKLYKLISIPVVGGLHHRYYRIAA
jgi:putative transposase